MHQRNDLLTAGLLVSLINALTLLGIGLMNSTDIILVLKLSLLGILNGALSSVLSIGILPFCEAIFGIVTSIKLLELSNPNQPVLKRLLYEAPGTYHHSIIVGNLAEAAVDVIDGNSLLARVGSYYHDIGKLKRPYFFKENQLTSDNPHDKIAPSLSTLIITNHIKDGVEIAKKYKLPGIIKDMIEQHHGTTLVKYFYYKAVNGNDTHDEVTETQFRYEGPKPNTREAAIVMLADSIEAAVRSIPSPTKPKIEDMVNKVIREKIADGQLDDSALTLRDINRITSAFLNVLTGIYHDRIEYPDMDPGSKGGDSDGTDDR
jgi:putative nucleotidyltransferase with HDIG domain